MLKIFDSVALIAFCGLIYWLSDQPSLPMPIVFELQDKIHHMLAYFVMGILAWRWFRHFISTPKAIILVSVMFCSAYGVSDEWHQSFVPGRSSEALDWVADTVGAVLAQYVTVKILLNRYLIDKFRGKTVQNL